MQVNSLKGIVERYVGEIDGKDTWETVYDPSLDGVSQLEFLVNEIKRDERNRLKYKLTEFIKTIA